jgi:hypothetical protein
MSTCSFLLAESFPHRHQPIIRIEATIPEQAPVTSEGPWKWSRHSSRSKTFFLKRGYSQRLRLGIDSRFKTCLKHFPEKKIADLTGIFQAVSGSPGTIWCGPLSRAGGGIRRHCPYSPNRPPDRGRLGTGSGPRRGPEVPVTIPAPSPPAGWRFATPAELVLGPALVGRQVLFLWPADGWVRGTVVRLSRTRGFSHVVRYGSQSVLGSLEVVSLLDAESVVGPAEAGCY